ncbi:visual pigment-like receptor peropsin [Glandiceps talaboti]
MGASPEAAAPGQNWTKTGYILSGVSIATIGLLAFLGNTLVVWAFYRDKKLRTPANLFILSIAVSDLAISIVGNPFSATSNFAGRWLFGLSGCKWYAFANNFLGLVSLNTHAVIAIDRYIVIVRSRLGPHITHKKALVMALVAWIWSFIWAVFPLLGWSSYYFEGPGTMCSVKWQSNENHTMSYILCLFLFSFLLPICIMLFCYGSIYTTVKGSAVTQTAWDSESEAAKKNKVLQRKLLRTTCTIAVTFLIAWSPYSVIALWATFGDANNISKTTAAIPSIFAKSGTVYNPIIYVMTNEIIRSSFTKIVKCGATRDPGSIVTETTNDNVRLRNVHNTAATQSVTDKQATEVTADVVIPGQIEPSQGASEHRVGNARLQTVTTQPRVNAWSIHSNVVCLEDG